MSIVRTLSILHDASHHAFPVGRHGSIARRLKFIGRILPHRKINLRWFAFLQGDDFMRKLAVCDHRVYRKLYRPYLSTSWDRARVFKALTAHYAALRNKFPPATLEKIFLSDSHILAEWVSNRQYQLRISHDPRFYQEGEITVTLFCPELGEGELTQISGTLSPAENASMAFYIGGIQGAARTLGAQAIKEATRDLHGLRPKSLLVIVAQMLANRLGCKQILATSAACHAYSHDDRRHSEKRKMMFFDYDSFWEECRGTRVSEAFFALPLVAARRTREEMKPQKRPMYRRRYAMLDAIHAAIEHSLPVALESQA